MKQQIKTFLAGGVLALALFGTAMAGPLEDGQAAFDKGDYSTALSYWQPLAAQGNAVAQNGMGRMFARGHGVPQDYAQAVVWLSKAADQSYAVAQNNLGLMYAQGHGVTQGYAQAITWYRKAADQGNADAQNNLGVMYEVGHGVAQDYAQAVARYRKAADQGYAAAQYNIGRMYAKGEGVPRDYAQTLIWLRKAADQGYAPAQAALGWMYANGQGARQDYVRAHMWLNLAVSRLDDATFQMAARVGDDTRQVAVKALEDVAAKMTPVQIAEAQRLASEWKPSGRVGDAGAPSVSATLEPPVGAKGETVALVSDGGTFKVPVTINGQLTLKFVVDSGASDVSIPVDVVRTLWRTGTITDADFLDKQTYQLADGSTFPSQRFVIRALMIGDKTLENVVGGIAPAAGSLLLGQSFLGRFKSWSIDNQAGTLILN
jgi:TPR repeat protein